MPKSKAHKLISRFAGWAVREGAIKAEMLRAKEEFFHAPDRISAEDEPLAGGLFMDWFYLDRKLTAYNLTPFELYLRQNEKKLTPRERDAYRLVQENNQFGFFRVTAAMPGEWMDLQAVPKEDLFHVLEEAGSRAFRVGDFLAARLVPYEDHWALSGFFAMPFVGENREIVQQAIEGLGRDLAPKEFRPRDLVALIIPPVRWEEMGLIRVKAKLASLLEQWHIADMTVGAVEKAFQKAQDENGPLPSIMQELVSRAPSTHDMRLAMELLQALWNLMLSARPGYPQEELDRRGPREIVLLDNLAREVAKRLSDEGIGETQKVNELSKQMFREWAHKPQESLGGKTPMDVILEERKTLGNPQKEVGYSFSVSAVPVPEAENEAAKLANQGLDHFMAGRHEEALRLYTKAYPPLKNHGEAFRILGNMATSHVVLGHREEALECLRASLKANPDYSVARGNLHILDSMTPEEFQEKFKDGFFNNTVRVKDP